MLFAMRIPILKCLYGVTICAKSLQVFCGIVAVISIDVVNV
jgi:hypothetical protein